MGQERGRGREGMAGDSGARPAPDRAGAVPPAGGSPQLFLMFQLVDNLLPIGGFSHSQEIGRAHV